MAVTITKTDNSIFLSKLGIGNELIAKLKNLGIKIKFGSVNFTLFTQTEDSGFITHLTDGVFPIPVSSLLKPGVGSELHAQCNYILTKAIGKAVFIVISKGGTKDGMVHTDTNLDVLGPDPDHMPTVLSSFKSSLKPLAPEIVKLSEAMAIHQRVKGSSPGSVYVVVGITPEVRIAARVKGDQLSVRVETTGAPLPPKLAKAFAAQGVSMKDGYMSGHFKVNERAPFQKVLGCILFSSGANIVSQMPSMKKIEELSE